MLNFLLRFEYAGIIAFLTLCGLGLPIPEEAVVVLSGVLSYQETLDWYYALPSCLIGALLGDSVMYFIGRHFGHEWLTKHKNFARFIDPDREEQVEKLVLKHGFKVMLLTRFMFGVRGPVYYAAGAAKVPYLKFLLWDLVGASLVISVFFGLAFRYGRQIEKLASDFEITFTIIVLAALVVTGVMVYRSQKRRVGKAFDEMAAEDQQAEAPSEPGADLSASIPSPSTNGAPHDTASAPAPAAELERLE
ncbi:Inner membrane protein YohD [Pirellulimonas nuda]|uniref:Inner membrane protein YohD n=1 Tax=Pirellulimonas nuda TaxID=2528009 RepID=A0A518DIS6_9BACT|nr:DedA family protein [Pirellulimonas nuda]QDU91383.1 Inner membrane protein YohD [Pirellulimonas nuda]